MSDAPHPRLASSVMAGFDFDFRYDHRLEPLLRVCLPAAMSRSRKLGLRWRNVRLDDRAHRCVIDGNGRRMALLAHALERDLPEVAEGADVAGLTRAARQRHGLGFADLYIRGLDCRTDGLMTWRGDSATNYYFSPYELSDTEHAVLASRLRITEGVILDWWFKRTDGVVLLEELHTAAELVLEELVNRRSRRLSFSQLVTAAEEAGILDWTSVPEVVGVRAIQPSVLLLELKDFRKHARHSGSRTFEGWLDANWESVTLVLERLVRRLEPAL